MIAALAAAMAPAAAMTFPAASGAAETTITNNLSTPTIWSEGLTLSPRGTYGAPVFDGTPTTVTIDGTSVDLYLQGDEANSWQAENTVATAPVNVSQIDWGDNIESRTLSLTSPIRVETTLLENLTTTMTGFTMYSAGGTKDAELFGTDKSTYSSTQADIYSGCARLTIQRLDISRDDPYISRLTWDAANGQWTGTGLVAAPIVNTGVWSGGGYGAEINGSGSVVYGYNWSPTGLTAGDYRVTFSLDPNCPVAALNTFITPDTTIYTTTETAAALPAAGGGGGGGGETGGGAVAKIDATDNLTYIDVQLGSPTYTPYVPPTPVNTAPPTISGTTTIGQVLSATTGSWDYFPTSYTYQWQSCDSTGANCTNITGATGASYTLTAADVDHTMRVVVTAANADGSASATSAATTVVLPLAPVSTALPTILGSAQSGRVLLATNGMWSNTPSGYSYQWQLCDETGSICTDIAGANGGSYTLSDAFIGSRLRVIVTATNPGGSTAAASAPTAVITGAQQIKAQQQLRLRSRITLHLKWLAGDRLHLWGNVSPARNGTRLTLQRRTTSGWKTTTTVMLRKSNNQSSQFSVTLAHMSGGIYRAFMAANTKYLAVNSAQIRARDRAHVTLRLHQANGRFTLTGTVSPPRNGRQLMIQMRNGNGWKKIATVRLRTANRTHSQYTFSIAGLKPGTYRAYYRGDPQYRAGSSGTITAH